ncbi:5-oxoprolinase subunit PxpB [Leuconostoc gelidum subsp. aenigmaticum]|uniref:5-oxoprolinase subunit PxpB n=1 Tax=Leuconostoc gelidum TaxID=1244 RepID=UPI001CC58901|nr:5-oxoprolinase subunit PxpB [Leuconostoc gelidum]MBZ6008308.1 5-oxoprolinase subunit PxpB [Leuconostoc gelidum subsp. aenigmaticum]
MSPKIIFSGDTSINVVFENVLSEEINNQVLAIANLVKNQHIVGLLDIVPAYREVTFVFDPLIIDIVAFKSFLQEELTKPTISLTTGSGKIYEIPVLYNETVGLDLLEVTNYHGLSMEEVIRLHVDRAYRIYMLGFLPGFAYLGGLDKKLHTPRKNTPRLQIPAGSIGIGGEQTGYYPVESPGGWQIIGKTPIVMFDSNHPEIKLHAGDKMKFYAIDEPEYKTMKGTHFNDFFAEEIMS